MRVSIPLLVALVLCWSAPARADKMAKTLDIVLEPRAGLLDIDRSMVPAPGSDGVDQLMASNPRLRGTGYLWGAVRRLGFTSEWARYGLGIGAVGASGLALEHEPLADGLDIDASHIWGIPVEGYAGFSFGKARSVRALIELRARLVVRRLRPARSDNKRLRVLTTEVACARGCFFCRRC